MNFRRGSKQPLTPTPRPSEWSLSLEIMCMYFILSGPHTSLRIFDHIHYNNCNIIFRKWGGGVEDCLEFIKNHPIWYRHSSLLFGDVVGVWAESLQGYSVQIGEALFLKESYTTLGIEPRTSSYPRRIICHNCVYFFMKPWSWQYARMFDIWITFAEWCCWDDFL